MDDLQSSDSPIDLKEAEGPPMPPNEELRILIVDDTPQNIQVLGTILREEKYQLNVAQNGLQALEMAGKVIPDLILLDIMMPEMDGFEACKHLKENPVTNEIPIIFLTAKIEVEDVIQGFDLGAVDYVTKPFNPTELLRRVHTHLELKVARDRFRDLSVKLGKYLSPQVYRSVFLGERDVVVQSHRRDLTVFFSDIVGFTPTTESMGHQELTNWLNNYLNEMSEITLRHGGTLDKFVGDSVMVFFGDPATLGVKEDAVACVQMALDMQSKAAEMDVGIRMGINSGECTVGNFGSEDRMDYTIFGKDVNAASRLESGGEPGRILVSETTYELVKDKIRCEERGPIQVKGIDRDLMTYWALGHQ